MTETIPRRCLENLPGGAHVALGGDGIFGEQLDVTAEQLLDARLPDQPEVSCQATALLDVLTRLREPPAHRLEQRDEAGEVRVQRAVLGLAAQHVLEPVQPLGYRRQAVDRAEGVLPQRPADLASVACPASVLGRLSRRVDRLLEPALAPQEVGNAM